MDELSIKQQRHPPTVSQLMARIKELQDTAASLTDARDFHDLETASSSSGESRVTSHRPTIPSSRTVLGRDSGVPLMTSGATMRPQQQDLPNSNKVRHTGGTYSHDGMMEYPRIFFRNIVLQNSQTPWTFKAGKPLSRLKFVRKQRILRSQCSGSQKLRKQSQLTN